MTMSLQSTKTTLCSDTVEIAIQLIAFNASILFVCAYVCLVLVHISVLTIE